MAWMDASFDDCLGSVAIANTYATSYMLYPDDTARREAHQALFLAGFAKETDAGLSGWALDRITGAARDGTLSAEPEQVQAGSVAGDVLLSILTMAHNDIDAPGVAKAVFLVSELYPHFRGANGKGYSGISARNVERNWHSMRAVAHLWAAWLILCREAALRSPDGIAAPVSADGRLLPLAHDLLELGVRYRAPRSAGPILDAEKCWQMRGIEAISRSSSTLGATALKVSPASLTSFEIKVLQRYRP